MALVFLNLAWAVPSLAQETVPQEPAAQEQLQQSPPEEGLFGVPIHGTFAFKYRGRWSGGEHDQDLYEYLAADAGNPDTDRVTANLFVRISEDVDGDRHPDRFFLFSDITNTYHSGINERLYYGYLDVHRIGPVEKIRLGRQFHYETPVSLYFDGGTVTTKECAEFQRARLGVYGGVPVHPFESPVSGDSIAGAWLQSDLWRGAKARVDFSRIRDSRSFGTETNDFWAVNVWQNLGKHLQLQYQHTFLDSDNRDLLARASFWESVLDLRAQASFYYLMETQRIETTDLDFFTSAAQEYRPYWQARLLLGKSIADHVAVQVGFDARELVADFREGPFNREFRRYFVTPTVTDWPVRGFGAGFTWEVWDVPGGSSGDLATYGLDARYVLTEGVKVSAGTEYSLYKFDVLNNAERERVRTYFARVNCSLTPNLRLDAAFEFEDGQEDDFTTVKIGASQDF